ncbi:MAG: hypothetical protein ACOYL5_16605 [Phototrophicaceae bacterium]
MSDNKSIFSEDWRECLEAHYKDVVRRDDNITQETLPGILLNVGFGTDDLKRWAFEATLRADEYDRLPDAEIVEGILSVYAGVDVPAPAEPDPILEDDVPAIAEPEPILEDVPVPVERISEPVAEEEGVLDYPSEEGESIPTEVQAALEVAQPENPAIPEVAESDPLQGNDPQQLSMF